LVLSLAPRLRAEGFDATPCPDDEWQCRRGWLTFDESDSRPIEWMFDSGWTPPSGPLQVRLWGAVHATTQVTLKGSVEVSWPEALRVEAPGLPAGGLLAYHYGADIGAEGKVQVTIANQTYSWQGDLPYVPQVDFQVEASEAFDAWAFEPGVSVSDSSPLQQIAEIDIAGLIGPSIPGIGGGFELLVALDIEVSYWTERIVVRGPQGTALELLDPDAFTQIGYAGEPFIELDVHPEGVVRYSGVLHLVPAFYISLLGNNWSIPVADIPIALPDEERAWLFDAQRVHVPLPDLLVEDEAIDFGQVPLGDEVKSGFELSDAGEADARVELSSSDPDHFVVDPLPLVVGAGESVTASVRFVPGEARSYLAAVAIDSNDPDAPEQLVIVRGEGVDDAASPTATPAVAAEGGCGCRAAAAGEPTRAGWALAIFGLILGARRRLGAASTPAAADRLAELGGRR
jgi:MYXO-CTERM domain-containing protein